MAKKRPLSRWDDATGGWLQWNENRGVPSPLEKTAPPGTFSPPGIPGSETPQGPPGAYPPPGSDSPLPQPNRTMRISDLPWPVRILLGVAGLLVAQHFTAGWETNRAHTTPSPAPSCIALFDTTTGQQLNADVCTLTR